jgi:hypothetical protein
MIYKLKVTKKDEYEERLYLVPQTGELRVYFDRGGKLEDITKNFQKGWKWNLYLGGRVDIRILRDEEVKDFKSRVLKEFKI